MHAKRAFRFFWANQGTIQRTASRDQDLPNRLRRLRRADPAAVQADAAMIDPVLRSEAQMRRLESYFPPARGIPEFDARLIATTSSS
jgi:hypothetical protein